MPSNDAKTVRGLSIAVIVISILAILFGLGLFAIFGGTTALLADPEVQSSMTLDIEGDADVVQALNEAGVSSDNAGVLTLVLMALMTGGIFWCIFCCAFTLIAGIIDLRNAEKPEKLGLAFGWAIAGIVFSVLGGNVVLLVLLIIAAVKISGMRKFTVPMGQSQPPMQQTYQQQPPYQQ